jgi:lipopolysaccharide export system permease protein
VNLLDRYIFKSVLFTCVVAVALFTFVLTLGNVIRDLLSHVLAGQFPIFTIVELVTLWIPAMAVYALPMGLLTGVLLTLGRLSAESEITAMRANGISLRRLAWPVFLLAGLSAAGALYINFESMPWARVTYESKFATAVRTNPLNFLVPNTFIRDFPGFVIYVGDRQGTLLRDLWLWELDSEHRVTRFVRAESGRLDYDEQTNSLVPHLLNFRSEERNRDNPEDFSKSPYAPAVQSSGDNLIRINLDRVFDRKTVHAKPEWLTYAQLQNKIEQLATQPLPPDKTPKEFAQEKMQTAIVLHEKVNLALAVFSFAFIAVPLGIKVSRRETSANLGLALGLVLGYYFLTVMIKWLDRHPEYRPDLLLWVPNLLFIAVGIWLFRRIERQTR